MGQGGEEFSQKFGFPGEYYAKNITPYGIRDWSDGEVLRAVSCGVSKNGTPLFPVMPYLDYGLLDRTDIYAIIAYIRTLNPIENNIPASVSDFPMNFIIHTIPQRAIYSIIPDRNKRVAYGEYLFIAASCADCHTPQDKGKPIKGMDLAGGFKLPLVTGGTIVTANITPDMQTGIGGWSEEAFVTRFKAYTDVKYKPLSISHGHFNTYMPWTMFSTMQTDDLKALYAYLKTVKPVNNKITKFIPE
jgi:mono/diheme cytochrome c family protein